jgi:transposase
MMHNHKAVDALANSKFYEFCRLVEYKTERYGSCLILLS